MNYCIPGGLGDGDGGEDGEEGGGGAGGGGLLPRRRYHGGAPPLSPFLHGFLGAFSHGDGIHGGGKNVALVAANSWVEVSPTN